MGSHPWDFTSLWGCCSVVVVVTLLGVFFICLVGFGLSMSLFVCINVTRLRINNKSVGQKSEEF